MKIIISYIEYHEHDNSLYSQCYLIHSWFHNRQDIARIVRKYDMYISTVISVFNSFNKYIFAFVSYVVYRMTE